MFRTMKRTRKRVITFESRSQTIVYRGGVRYEVRCDLCGSKSISILPEGATDVELRRHEEKLQAGICLEERCGQFLEQETLRFAMA